MNGDLPAHHVSHCVPCPPSSLQCLGSKQECGEELSATLPTEGPMADVFFKLKQANLPQSIQDVYLNVSCAG